MCLITCTGENVPWQLISQFLHKTLWMMGSPLPSKAGSSILKQCWFSETSFGAQNYVHLYDLKSFIAPSCRKKKLVLWFEHLTEKYFAATSKPPKGKGNKTEHVFCLPHFGPVTARFICSRCYFLVLFNIFMKILKRTKGKRTVQSALQVHR